MRFNKELLFTIITLTMFLITAELICFFLLDKKFESECINCSNNTMSKKIGLWHKPNYSHKAKKVCSNSKSCYEATYTYDQHGRRYNDYINSEDSNLILLGGSFVFGEGLKFSDSLAGILKNKYNINTKNYSKPGMGASFTLRLIESLKIKEEIQDRKQIGIYFLANFHIPRESISTSRPWAWKTPAYTIVNNQLLYAGSQIDTIGFESIIYRSLSWLNSNSNVFKLINFQMSRLSDKENQILVVKTLSRANTLFKEQFHGEFYVVGHPLDPPNDELIQELIEEGVKYISIDRINTDLMKPFLCSCDHHPNKQANTYLVEELMKKIKLK